MTEEQWDACTDPDKMLDALWARGLVSERKLRLSTAAECRRVWPDFDGTRQAAVETLERSADGQAGEAELNDANKWASCYLDLPPDQSRSSSYFA